jgi:uncharacterized protein (DUF4415 family)
MWLLRTNRRRRCEIYIPHPRNQGPHGTCGATSTDTGGPCRRPDERALQPARGLTNGARLSSRSPDARPLIDHERRSPADVVRANRAGAYATRELQWTLVRLPAAQQLKAMRRVGRPPLGDESRCQAIRVDPGVLDQFRKEAHRRRVGYQSLINEVLARHVRKRATDSTRSP